VEPRLKTGFWVQALIRRCAVQAVPAVVVRHGFEDAGAVLLKINGLQGQCYVLSAGSDLEGDRVWRRATGPGLVAEAEADGYIAREAKRDPDLWVIEIEDRALRHFLDDPVIGDESPA
jgi:hypothetical protein